MQSADVEPRQPAASHTSPHPAEALERLRSALNELYRCAYKLRRFASIETEPFATECMAVSLWAMGATLYWLLPGKLDGADAETLMSLMNAIAWLAMDTERLEFEAVRRERLRREGADPDSVPALPC